MTTLDERIAALEECVRFWPEKEMSGELTEALSVIRELKAERDALSEELTWYKTKEKDFGFNEG